MSSASGRSGPWGPQRAIADYLDTETARIDSLIARKRQLVELMRRAPILGRWMACSSVFRTSTRRTAEARSRTGHAGLESTMPEYRRQTELTSGPSLRPELSTAEYSDLRKTKNFRPRRRRDQILLSDVGNLSCRGQTLEN